MDHKAWLEWRRGGIGSSDIAVLEGSSTYMTKYELWKEKVHGITSQEDNEAMAFGREHEPKARKWIEDTYDLFLEPRNVERADKPWMRCSLDAVTFDGKRAFEIKCPYKNLKYYESALQGIVPEIFVPQMMWQMAVCDLESLTCTIRHPYCESYASATIYIDRLYCNMLEAEAHRFWHEHVLKRIPPEMTDKDLQDFEGNHQWEQVCQLYKENKHMLELYEKKDKTLREEIVSLTKGKSAMGNGLKVLKYEPEGRIDYDKAIDDFNNELSLLFPTLSIPLMSHERLEKYRKPSTTRFRFTINKDVTS
jgi:putative phage-type endonuclease